MNTPSVNVLKRIFNENAKLAKTILTCATAELVTPEVQQLRGRASGKIGIARYMVRLTALNALGNFHGIETLSCSNHDEYAEYLNAGDIYNETIIYWRGRYRVQTVGDFVERMERQGVKFS